MHNPKLTKIVATIGPVSESKEIMAKLIDAGVNLFRFNTKHSTPEWHSQHIRQAQSIADEKGVTLGILLDLQGPEIRLETRNKADYPVKQDQIISLGLSYVDGVDVIIPHAQVFKLIKKGHDLLIDDGFVETEVLEVSGSKIVVKVKNDSVIKHRKGVNLPGIEVDFPSLIDAVMVARGDLGIEVPIEQLAYWQKILISKCRVANKPVITATQMLESMISNPRPTRAESTDVAHAVLDGTDAIMLSGESASGKYPVRTVETMAKIAKWNEKLRGVETHSYAREDATTIVAEAAVSIVRSHIKPKLDAVVVFTETGFTALAISRYRLTIPIIAVTDNKSTAECLTLSFGVTPVVAKFPTGAYTSSESVLKELKDRKIIASGDNLVLVHGHHWQKPGNTNSLSIITI